MSDLISRSMYKSKLLKALDVLNKEYREAMLNEDNDLIFAIQNQQSAYMIALRLLDNEPIAYDINNVVEELEEIKDEYDNSCIDNAYQRGVKTGAKWVKKKAIEIVKQGVVSDDMCQWKKHRIIDNVQMCKTSCLYEIEERLVKKYRYCPYCGKKIKGVE